VKRFCTHFSAVVPHGAQHAIAARLGLARLRRLAPQTADAHVELGATSNFSDDLLMADQNDIILNTINQQMDQARHSEDQWSTLTNILLGIVVVLQGYIVQRGFDKPSKE
jgi:hypothetical protein